MSDVINVIVETQDNDIIKVLKDSIYKGDPGVGISSIVFDHQDAQGNRIYNVNLTNGTYYQIQCDKGAKGSEVSVSPTGTSQNVVSYITIDGVESKIGGLPPFPQDTSKQYTLNAIYSQGSWGVSWVPIGGEDPTSSHVGTGQVGQMIIE